MHACMLSMCGMPRKYEIVIECLSIGTGPIFPCTSVVFDQWKNCTVNGRY
jgi:hypothetical protein